MCLTFSGVDLEALAQQVTKLTSERDSAEGRLAVLVGDYEKEHVVCEELRSLFGITGYCCCNTFL